MLSPAAPQPSELVALLPQHQVFEQKQVIVRCTSKHTIDIRVWPIQTYLLCHQTKTKSKLLFFDGILAAPDWKQMLKGQEFLLVFEGLPKACTSFLLIEDIPYEGNFFVPTMKRNGLDVYDVFL